MRNVIKFIYLFIYVVGEEHEIADLIWENSHRSTIVAVFVSALIIQSRKVYQN